MTRNTHDRQLDHHGNDLDSNIELGGATASYITGSDLHAVISGMDDRIVATEAPDLGMLPRYATAPLTPLEGQSYYDTTLHMSRTWNGTAWRDWWT